MKKIVLLVLGLILLLIQHSTIAIPANTQIIIFIVGILFLGVPHGAADVLVAERNADVAKKKFSKNKFCGEYTARLVIFACVLYFFPVAGNIIFILFAAYHFGETDLHQFKTNTLPGKLLVVSYGLVILSVILLPHFDDVIPMYQAFDAGSENQDILHWISVNRYSLMTANAVIFLIAIVIYFLKNKSVGQLNAGLFLVRFGLIVLILFNLPILLGFTFYFVVWHSLLSLDNIINYLREKNKVSYKKITKEIALYSFLAIAGISVFGMSVFMFANESAIAQYIVISLAVLTAPHMEVMYEMYTAIRNKQQAIS